MQMLDFQSGYGSEMGNANIHTVIVPRLTALISFLGAIVLLAMTPITA